VRTRSCSDAPRPGTRSLDRIAILVYRSGSNDHPRPLAERVERTIHRGEHRMKQDFRDLGERCAPLLLDALQNGTEDEQYAAVLGLRLFGYYASADGYGGDLVFEVREPGATDVRIIKPKITPREPEHSDDETE